MKVIILLLSAFFWSFLPMKALSSEGSSSPSPAQSVSTEKSPPAPLAEDTELKSLTQKWHRFPTFAGVDLDTKTQTTFAPIPGFVSVVIFTASYCEPCQDLAIELQKIEKHYASLYTRFLYVYSHDTFDDARGSKKELKLANAMLANFEILHTFHNPELPTIYVSDRHGWLMTRFVNIKVSDVGKIEEMLRLLTSY